MLLKHYQETTLTTIQQYLTLLAKEHDDGNRKHASADAWEAAHIPRPYVPRKNGLGEDLPNFCLKIPTGGGKTFLAVKTIDLISTHYRRRQTGFVLWIVPTTQIYNQTLAALRDRSHPYRQTLDMATGGRTKIIEKTDRFAPQDVEESLVVLILMLPAANRQTKETLRMFRDNGGFASFFPPEDNPEAHAELLRKISNLDCFEESSGLFGRQIKTSLGNTLRLLRPVIILDEGHKAYSEMAQETLRGFNPSLVVELSATPLKESNVLISVTGRALNDEGMIKLDLHIINKASTDWHDTLLSSIEKRNSLEEKAVMHHGKTGVYIRPICLIQVERTGKDQRGGEYIHSEDVREYLIQTAGIPPEQIAVKTSEKDELKDVDDVGGLFGEECPIRYIITKQALQEGWDCSFAYVLTILTNPTSQTALTQLVGRILRQPYGHKTGVAELDESYVYCFQRNAPELLAAIRNGFDAEGLGDLKSGVAVTDESLKLTAPEKRRMAKMRTELQRIAEQITLPVFVAKRKRGWQPVEYECDIESRINWSRVDISPLFTLTLSETVEKDREILANWVDDDDILDSREVRLLHSGGLSLDMVMLTRHLLSVVPNPWVAYAFADQLIAKLRTRYDERMVELNFVFIQEELKKHLQQEKDRMSEQIFRGLIENGTICFLVGSGTGSFRFPEEQVLVANGRSLTQRDGRPLAKNLLDPVDEDELDTLERDFVWHLEGQDKLLFWFRNVARRDYAVQGWRRHKIYPDFIFTLSKDRTHVEQIRVAETKGMQLMGNEDTTYKETVFALCNQLAGTRADANGLKISAAPLRYDVFTSDDWERRLNGIFHS